MWQLSVLPKQADLGRVRGQTEHAARVRGQHLAKGLDLAKAPSGSAPKSVAHTASSSPVLPPLLHAQSQYPSSFGH